MGVWEELGSDYQEELKDSYRLGRGALHIGFAGEWLKRHFGHDAKAMSLLMDVDASTTRLREYVFEKLEMGRR